MAFKTHEAASEMHPEWQGVAFNARPYKTHVEDFFYITWIGGQK